MDSSVTIYVKLKPDEKSEIITISRDQGEIRFQDPKSHVYHFSRIFPQNITIPELFDTTTKPYVNFLKGGVSSVVLAYGHKSTGKKSCLFGEQKSGLFQLLIENLAEYAEETENTKEITISLSVIELVDDQIRDLAEGVKRPDEFVSKHIEVKEHLGKALIGEIRIVDVKNISEANELLLQCFEFRKSWELKNGEYADNAHTFVLVSLKQRNKGSSWNPVTSSTLVFGVLAPCERPKIRSGKEHYEFPNTIKGFSALSKVLANLKSAKVPWKDHPLTKIIKLGLSETPKIAIIVTINPHKNYLQDTIHALNFAEKFKPNQTENNLEKLNEQEIEGQIQKLLEEKADLKGKLRKIEVNQDLQMKRLCELMGISDDIDGVINESNPQEVEKLQSRKESLSRIDGQVKRNQELQKKVEDGQSLMERFKRTQFSNQETHLKKVIDLKEHLQRLKDELLTIKLNSKHYELQKIEAKSEELSKMVENSKCLILEKTKIVGKLPQTLTPAMHAINPEELKSAGKQEIIEIYRKRMTEQKAIHEAEIQNLNQKKGQILNEKKNILNNMVSNFTQVRSEKKAKIKNLSGELVSLYEVILSQKKLIAAIKNGKFNQNLKTVNIPADRESSITSIENFEILQKLVKGREKNSSHPIKKLKESDILKKDYVPEVFVEVKTLYDEELSDLIESLQSVFKTQREEISGLEKKQVELSKIIEEKQETVISVRNDKDLYRDLHCKEQRQRNERKFLIENQKKIIENIISIPTKSPKRPASQGLPRGKK